MRYALLAMVAVLLLPTLGPPAALAIGPAATPAAEPGPLQVRRGLARLAGEFQNVETRLRALPPRTSNDAAAAAALRDEAVELLRQTDDLVNRRTFELPTAAPQKFATLTFARLMQRAHQSATPAELADLVGLSLETMAEFQASLAEFEEASALFPDRLKQLGAARDELGEILAADEFRVSRDRFGEVIQILSRRMSEFFSWLGVSENRAGLYSQRLMQIILVVSITILGVLLTRYGLRYLERRRHGRPRPATVVPQVRRLDTHQSHAAAAAQALQAGQLRLSLHHTYLMVLAAIERKQLVPADRTRTNWEYEQQLRGAIAATAAGGLPTAAVRLSEMNRIYDRKWYGGEPLTEPEVRQFEQLARQLVTEIGYEKA